MSSDLHISLEDKTGDSAIIEYVDGKAKVYHDPSYTVMTNEPTLDKQLENLKKYRSFGGEKPLPGERIPTNSFVRAAYYSKNLPEPKDATQGTAFMFSILQNISVPFGAGEPGKPNVSNPLFRTVKNLTNDLYYFESTYGHNIVWVDINLLNFDSKQPELKLHIENQLDLSGNVTEFLQATKPFNFNMK